MIGNDDKLIAEFFNENRLEIADKGFSEHVMRHLPPSRVSCLNRIWTVLCSIIGVAFFLLIDGIDSLRTALGNVLGDIIGYAASIDLYGVSPLMIVLTLFTIVLVGIYNLVVSE